jgi:hypothetical protein
MFGDHAQLKIAGVELKVRRMTVAEIRAARVRWQGGKELIDDEYDRIIREHVETADGKEIDPSNLSLPQMQRIVSEIVGIPEGNRLSDFIGLLC